MATQVVVIEDGIIKGAGANPTKNDCFKWNGSAWVATVYDTSFTFSIKSFAHDAGTTASLIGASTLPWKAIGELAFTADYNNPYADPTPYIAVTGAGNSPANIDMTPAAPDPDRYKGPTTNPEAINWPSANGSRITFVLNAVAGADPPSSMTIYSMYFYNHFVYYDLDHNSGFTSADIDGMAAQHQILTTTPNSQTFTLSIGAANYLCMAHPAAHTAIAQVRCGTGNNVITVAMNKNDATAVTPLKETITNYVNANGKTENFSVYGSKLQNLDAHSTTFVMLSSSTPQNYLFWGKTSDAGPHDEADIEGLANKRSYNFSTDYVLPTKVTLSSEYLLIAFPSRLGDNTTGAGNFILKDNGTQLPLGMEATQHVDVTNPCGFQEECHCWRSTQLLTVTDLEIKVDMN